MRPMLAAKLDDLSIVKYPVYVQPKYDGIRCIVRNGSVLSRTLKPIPNRWISEVMLAPLRAETSITFDGELVFPGRHNFNEVQSAVMSIEGEPTELRYVMFDCIKGIETFCTYHNRLDLIRDFQAAYGQLYTDVVPQSLCLDAYEVNNNEEYWLSKGYEGIILRPPFGVYKYGRSTPKEQGLMKLKRLEDAEAVVLECLELERNLNKPTTSELGLTKRSSHQDNKEPSGMLGSFRVKVINGPFKDVECSVAASTLEVGARIFWWKMRKALVGKIITFTYNKNRTTKDRPLEPRFKAFREDL